MAKGILTWGGVSSDTFNLFLAQELDLTKPERDVGLVQIPGRDGNLTVDNNRYDAVDQTFNFVFASTANDDIESLQAKITGWLYSVTGINDLLLDIFPNHIFKARISGSPTITLTDAFHGTVSVTFTLYPYKFLKSGQTQITASPSINNPTAYPASPIYMITGSGNGSLTINGIGMGFQNVNGGLVIDIEKQTVMDLDGEPAYSTMTSEVFPVLKPGINTLSWTDGWTVKLIPKWKEVI